MKRLMKIVRKGTLDEQLADKGGKDESAKIAARNIFTNVARPDSEFMESSQEHWYPNPSVVLGDVDDMNRLKISVSYRINLEDTAANGDKRELLVKEIINILQEINIEHWMPHRDINV